MTFTLEPEYAPFPVSYPLLPENRETDGKTRGGDGGFPVSLQHPTGAVGGKPVEPAAPHIPIAAFLPDQDPVRWNNQQLDRLLNCLSWQPALAATWILHRAAYYRTTYAWPLNSCNFQAALDWELARLSRQLPHGTKQQRAAAYFTLMEHLI